MERHAEAESGGWREASVPSFNCKSVFHLALTQEGGERAPDHFRQAGTLPALPSEDVMLLRKCCEPGVQRIANIASRVVTAQCLLCDGLDQAEGVLHAMIEFADEQLVHLIGAVPRSF